MPQNLEQIANVLLEEAQKAGADAADTLAVKGTSVSIDVRAGQLEQAERSEGIDIGLRVVIGQKQAIVSASDTSPAMLAEMAERAVAMAKMAPDDPHVGLADADQLATDWDLEALELCDPADEPEPSELQASALEAEQEALDVAGVEQVQTASAAYGANDIYLAATNGFSAGYRRTDRALSCIAIARTGVGMERDYDGDMRIFQSDLRTAQDIGRTAGQRAVARVGATRPKTGTYPVLFDERISSSLIGHLLGAINGSAIARGSSWAMDLLGKQILPPELSLIEDPLRPRVSGSRPFDAEGLPKSKRVLVENGVLSGWTLDLATGRKLGMSSTANAGRGTGSAPSPSSTNVALTLGVQSRDDLIKSMGTGLLVTSMIGATINPNTGDYSRGTSGFWIENGEITGPVNECTIAGNLIDMLKRIIPANDARPHLSRVVPSLLIEDMTLAGD